MSLLDGPEISFTGIGIRQHLVRRNSSVTTGESAVSLNPDLVTEVRWWTHRDFGDRNVLQAAELVAFEVHQPALRSRGGIPGKAKELYEDSDFRGKMAALFDSEPAGRLVIRTLREAFARIADLEKRLGALEARLDV